MNWFAKKLLAIGLATLFCAPVSMLAQEPTGTGNSQTPTASSSQNDAGSDGLPESPGATQSNQSAPPAAISPSALAGSKEQAGGAAAAPAVEVTGNAVSRPAGSAIAPPKQRQVRSFLIKMGLIAGAGVALGTVAALSISSPARVPGSH